MLKAILEALEDPNWHLLREGLVIVHLKTMRTTEDFGPELLASRLKNRDALGGVSSVGMGQESFVVDLSERGIDADALAVEVCSHLEPGDICWFAMANSQGMAIRRVYG